jgi:hypothetical protein
MKLFLAILAYAVMAVILGAGIIQVMDGKPWLLIIGAVGFIFTFGKIGCKSQ